MLNDSNGAKWVKYLYNGKNGGMKIDLKELLKKSDQQSEKVTYEEMDTLLKFNQCECWDLENMMTTLKKGEFDS